MILLIALVLAGPIRIGLVRTANAGPLYVALEEGLFKEAGLEPRVDYLSSDAAVADAVANGKIDIGFTALSAGFYRAAAARGFKLIASQATDQSHFPLDALLISKKAHDAGFVGVRELPHKRIAMGDQESGVRYALNRIAERFHLEPAVPVFTKDPLKAVARGEADAALLSYPAALQSKGGFVLRLSDLAQWQQSLVFVGKADAALIEAFLKAYRQGATDYSSNFLQYDDGGGFIAGPRHPQLLAAIARESHVRPEVLSVTKAYCDPHANLDVEDLDRQIKFWQSLGKLDPKVTIKDLIDG
jgi:ABC-type nitrate/sulfonate/bicarbonate transport system substrate-binding protein